MSIFPKPPTNDQLEKARDRAETMLHSYEMHLLRAIREFGQEMQRAAALEDAEQRSLAVSGVGAVAVNKMAKKIGLIIGAGAVVAGNHGEIALERYIKANFKQMQDTIRSVAKEYIRNATRGPDGSDDKSTD